MDPNNGQLYASLDHALAAGVEDAVAISGSLEAVERISKAVRDQQRAKRKDQKKARRLNR